jgi:hypothetical protein
LIVEARVIPGLFLWSLPLPCGDFAADDADAGYVANLPIGDGVGLTAVEAGGFVETSSALRTHATLLKRIELGCALVTTPERAHGRWVAATRTGESRAPRNLFQFSQSAGSFESVPAIHPGIGGDQAQPDGLLVQRQKDKAGDPYKSENRCDEQAARAPEWEPEQRTEDLSAIEGVDGQDIEDEEIKIDGEDF